MSRNVWRCALARSEVTSLFVLVHVYVYHVHVHDNLFFKQAKSTQVNLPPLLIKAKQETTEPPVACGSDVL